MAVKQEQNAVQEHEKVIVIVPTRKLQGVRLINIERRLDYVGSMLGVKFRIEAGEGNG